MNPTLSGLTLLWGLMKTKLHLGCGGRYLPGYLHIDIDDLEHVDYVTSINKLYMFEDESVDEIYTCGALIYCDREEIPGVLSEWRRVMKPGAALRISVPDFESIIQRYFDSGKILESRGILGPLFGRWPASGVRTGLSPEPIYQKTTYDFSSLKRSLENNGFKDVKKYDWKNFLPADYDDYSKAYYPHMDESGMLMVLNVECVK